MSTDVEHSVIGQFRQLYDQGLYLQAYELVKPLGPLQEWTDPGMQVLGGRLANNLGSRRLGRIMIRSAFRSQPQDHETTYFYAHSMTGRWKNWEWRG